MGTPRHRTSKLLWFVFFYQVPFLYHRNSAQLFYCASFAINHVAADFVVVGVEFEHLGS